MALLQLEGSLGYCSLFCRIRLGECIDKWQISHCQLFISCEQKNALGRFIWVFYANTMRPKGVYN